MPGVIDRIRRGPVNLRLRRSTLALLVAFDDLLNISGRGRPGAVRR